jgi:hypothetical protein
MAEQLLHFVFGGEVVDTQGFEFADLDKLDIVRNYPNYKTAFGTWKRKSQAHVDNSSMKYAIVHIHRLFDPETGKEITN